MTQPMVDTSWNRAVNPENTPWLPGYRFSVLQDAKKPGRSSGRMRTRRYYVGFEIDIEGNLRHRGGVKPSARTLELVLALFERERPGSNGGPSLGDEPAT